ncbi:sentrin-specific protease 5 [Pseudophryne corroboree]|uniref:sentrin-specific protease 5 n=1 Tax=Pseudophryne corroboree TaxID=495146 RepID=UPI003081E35D
MKVHKSSRHRRGVFPAWSTSWTTLFGGFNSFLSWRHHGFLYRKLTNRRIKKVRKNQQVGRRIAKQRKKRKSTGQASRLSQNSLNKKELNCKNKLINCSSDIVTVSRKVARPQRTQKQKKSDAGKTVSLVGAFSNTLNSNNIATVSKKTTEAQKRKDNHEHSLVTCKQPGKRPRPSLKQRCCGGLWLLRSCDLFSTGRVPLFMMNRKPSHFTARGRLQSQKRKRSFKILDFHRLWFQKGFWNCCRKTLRSKLYKVYSYLKSRIQRPIKAVSRSYGMNNNTSGILCDIQPCTTKSCLKDETVKLQSVESQFATVASSRSLLKDNQQPPFCTTAQWCSGETVHKRLSDVPTINGYPGDVYVLTEKEISISCHEDTDAQGDETDAFMLLAPDKVQVCASENVGYQDNASLETMENGDDSSPMEVDENTDSDLFSTKLLDHPYCKSPLQKTTLEEELDVSTKQGLKNGQKIITITDEQLESSICGVLNEVIKKYGSLFPFSEKDILTRLKEVFNMDFTHRAPFISKEIAKFRAKHSRSSACNFRIIYNKHMLDMDDLTTLEGQNWLNDQVINMYGELIKDAVPDKVHFFNSFFHKQLMTKGYNGVKRWTKKVDLFKKTLLLIPIHLEVHWSLITVNIPNKIIYFYDSQGIHFKFCVENIRKYLITEAKEKNQEEFLQGWQSAVNKCIPQQKNDSDCGVFMLQYCKCLALEQPFQFSQEDMPRVRKRIYKELCDCRLMD